MNGQFKQRTINLDGTNVIEYGFFYENQSFQKFDKATAYPELDRLANLYRNENLLEIDGKKHPSVILASVDFKDLEYLALEEKFEINKGLKKFYEGVKAEKVKPKHTDGKRIRIVDYSPSIGNKNNLILTLQETSYFDFMMTNASQDLQMSKYDSGWNDRITLRWLDIGSDRKAIPLYNSIMSNMLGLAFVVRIDDNKKNPYLFFAKRKGDRTVGANTVSLLGGTPDWDDGLVNGSVHLRDIIYKNTQEELQEELGIPKNEFSIGKLNFCQDFTRAPTMIVNSYVGKSNNEKGKIVLEDMMDILSSTPSVRDEHSEFYAVPATKEGLNAIINNYNVNSISKTGFFLYLSHGKHYVPRAPSFFPFAKKK